MTQHSSIDVALMVKAFASKADLARHLGVTRSTVSMAVKRAKNTTHRMEWAERHRRIKAGIQQGHLRCRRHARQADHGGKHGHGGQNDHDTAAKIKRGPD